MLISTVMISSAAAQTPAPAAPPGPDFSFFIMMGLMFVVFYFLLIRPQQQARKKHMEMVQSVKRGDTVVTSGGIFGKVTKASDDPEIMVEIAEGVQVKVLKTTLTDVPSRTQPTDPKADKKK
ncbi:MAG: preprotein translocase subunit YajC [Pseudomonadota bacterium]